MTVVRLVTLATVLIAVAAPVAHAAPAPCQIAVRAQNTPTITGYNALAPGDATVPLVLTLTNPGAQPCSGALTFSTSVTGGYLVNTSLQLLTYRLVDPSDSTRVIYDPLASPVGTMPVAVAAGATVAVPLVLLVPGGQPGRSGRYYGALELAVGQGATVYGRAEVALYTQVLASVEANLVGVQQAAGSAAATLDFGDLKSGLTAGIGLQVRSSSDLAVTIQSAGNGALANPAYPADRVPYTLTFNQQPIDLTAPQRLAVALTNSVQSHTLPLVFTIGAIGNVHAGDYRDTLTLRISAR